MSDRRAEQGREGDGLGAVVSDLTKHLLWEREQGGHVWTSARSSAGAATAQPGTGPGVAPVVGAVASVPRAAGPVRTLEEIRAELGDCRRCKLCEGRKQIVFGVGNPRAELVFVGEGPGA